MTEQVNIAVMNRDEFEERHARTGQWIARVGKIWEAVAEEQQAIIDGKGYLYMGYSSWKDYWTKEWEGASGWTARTIEIWMQARRNKLSTPNVAGYGYEPESPEQWRNLGRIADPEERIEFLGRYESEIRPQLKKEGASSQIFREGVNRFLNECGPTVADIGEDMARQVARGEAPKIPIYREVNRSVRRLSSQIAGLDPQQTAQQLKQEQTETTLDWAVRDARELMEWLERYVAAIEHVDVVELRKVNDVH